MLTIDESAVQAVAEYFKTMVSGCQANTGKSRTRILHQPISPALKGGEQPGTRQQNQPQPLTVKGDQQWPNSS